MRDFKVIAWIFVGALAIGGVLFFFGPPSLQSDVQNALMSAQTVAAGGVPFTVLGQGMNADSVTIRANYRITNATDLASLWALVYGASDTPPTPPIDFSKYEVLGIFDGSHSTGGYNVQVIGITDKDPVRTVTIQHSVPAAGCNVATVGSSPFEIIEVPKTAFSLAHIDNTSASACIVN